MLYIVATPIGNLKDLTLRAIEILKSVDIVLAEDTRRARILLERYEIDIAKLISFHEHSTAEKIEKIIDELRLGKHYALITDAGTPGVSDPGGKLVAETIKNGINIVPIPGPSALSAILSVLPWPAEPVLFLGFLPKKKGRQTLLAQFAQNAQHAQTVVFFESPHRILRTLEELKVALGDCQIVVGRELTKKFEDIFYGTISEAIEHFQFKQKGEFTVAIKLSS